MNPSLEQNKNKPFLNQNNQKSNLALNTINCLIINHLKSSEYDYALSVFMPECGIGLNEVELKFFCTKILFPIYLILFGATIT